MLRHALVAAISVPLAISHATAQDAGDVIVKDQAGSEVRGDWVLGARVTSPDGASIGSIEDLVLDQGDGSVTAAVVSVGGFLGFGGKQIAVDWSELDINHDGNEITLDITRDDAEQAPEYSFRDRETPPAPDPATATGGTDTGTGGTGTGTGGTGGTGMGTGGTGGMGTGTGGAGGTTQGQ